MATGHTPNLNLPYPVPGSGEPANGPAQIKALAEQLETAVPAAVGATKAWAKNPDNLVVGAVAYDGNGLLATADVVWPDGVAGTLTVVSRQSGTDAVLSYTITRVVGATTTTYTQPTITRDSSGNATAVPQITVA